MARNGKRCYKDEKVTGVLI